MTCLDRNSRCVNVCIFTIRAIFTKSRMSCTETRSKFRVKFPGRPVPTPSTIRRQAKRFKDTGSVKNIKANHWRHVLTEKTLDEIGERLEHTPKNLWNVYHRKLTSVQRAAKLLKLHVGYVLWIYTVSHNENSCLGMSQIAIITITTLTALTYNNNHNQ